MISIETNGTCHGTFFEQHPKSHIIFLDTFDGAKRIELHKGGKMKPRVMKELQV
jgi:hypothetical protein